MLDLANYKLTGWQPDTCGCYFKLCWDGTKNDQGDINVVIVEATPCQDHAADTPAEVYAQAVAHNQAVNKRRAAETQEAGADVG